MRKRNIIVFLSLGMSFFIVAATHAGSPRMEAQAIEKSCSGGDQKSCFKLGQFHRDGRGVEVDGKRAEALFKSACDAGLLDACVEAGILWEEGAALDQNELRAADFYGLACGKGNMKGCARRGLFHLKVPAMPAEVVPPNKKGEASPVFAQSADGKVRLLLSRDEGTARDFLQKACQASEGLGCFGLGVLESGGTADKPVCTAQALPHYEKACQLRASEGCNALGRTLNDGTEQDASVAQRKLSALCEKGVGLACTTLGTLYRHGGKWLKADLMKARQSFERACAGEVPWACNDLGWYAEHGMAGEKDLKRAATFYQKACDKEVEMACANLAMLHLHGTGVPVDEKRGLQILEDSCERGFMDGCEKLGYLYFDGNEVTGDAQKAVARFVRACNGRAQVSCNKLGILHWQGSAAVAKDLDKARGYFDRACQADEQQSCMNLGLIIWEDGTDLERAHKLILQSCMARHQMQQASCQNLYQFYEATLNELKLDEKTDLQVMHAMCDQGAENLCKFLKKGTAQQTKHRHSQSKNTASR